ncbi:MULTISPECIES: HEPN domain-containing protein [Dyadobacter]|uniref:HEPN domain-containing protein n=1 Tax=Dyadobacter chenhuakuii TaxID=2909339 RepID=A0A9X1QGM7_9BACT|nr:MULTISPECIES: HEPN domain-containing protein [Dyadobacter]MCF2501151.1 HEPN domain-containing protein [Dyadobacter chenhuakuii]MCF2519422.1 HEPN domain-containing protein [Dyadobacter sp. CY351]
MSEVKLYKIIRKVDECLDTARDSLEGAHFEAVVNRSYYAIFHSIQALLHVQGVETKTHLGAHNKFRELYIKSELMEMSLTDMLQRTSDKRQFGDYDYEEVDGAQAEEALADAEYFTKAAIHYLKQNNHLK